DRTSGRPGLRGSLPADGRLETSTRPTRHSAPREQRAWWSTNSARASARTPARRHAAASPLSPRALRRPLVAEYSSQIGHGAGSVPSQLHTERDLDGIEAVMGHEGVLDLGEREPVSEERRRSDGARGEQSDGLGELVLINHRAEDAQLAPHHPEEV